MRHARYWMLPSSLVLLLALTGCGGPKTIGNQRPQSTEAGSSHVWNHDFKRGISSVSFTPKGLLTVWTRGKSKGDLPTQWFFNPANGATIWNGSPEAAQLVADAPLPVFLVLTDAGRIALACISPDDGRELWRVQPDEEIIYAGADPDAEAVVLVTVTNSPESSASKRMAVLRAISIRTGKPLFTTPLGDLSLTFVTPDDIVSFSNGIAWFACGGRAVALSMTSGAILWEKNLPSTMVKREGHMNLWQPFKGGMVSLTDRYMHLFSERSGVVWTRDLGESVIPRTIEILDAGILLGCWVENGAGVMLLDARNGKTLWEHKTTAANKQVVSPKGVAAFKDSVMYSINNKLVSVNLRDGSERFTVDSGVGEKVYPDFMYLLKSGDKAVLVGNWNYVAHDAETGKAAWGTKGFETPYAWWARGMNTATVMQAGLDNALASNPGLPGMPYQPRAATFRHYTMLDARNLNVPVLTRDTILVGGVSHRRLETKIMRNFGSEGSSLQTVGLGSTAWPGALRGGVNPDKYAPFMNSLQRVVAATFNGNVAAVDLETGERTFYEILSGGTQCSPVAFADSSLSWIVEIYQPVGPFCKKHTKIDVLKIQAPR